MANELHPEYDEETVREALDDLFQERWKGERHALWGEQLSQAMLNYALHATTMNRDRDPASADADTAAVDFAAFDGGRTEGTESTAHEGFDKWRSRTMSSSSAADLPGRPPRSPQQSETETCKSGWFRTSRARSGTRVG